MNNSTPNQLEKQQDDDKEHTQRCDDYNYILESNDEEFECICEFVTQ